jgi:hypothetical protein
MYDSVGLFTNTNEQLAHNVGLPGKLCRVGNVLPLATAVSE